MITQAFIGERNGTHQNKVYEEPVMLKLPFKQKKSTVFTGP